MSFDENTNITARHYYHNTQNVYPSIQNNNNNNNNNRSVLVNSNKVSFANKNFNECWQQYHNMVPSSIKQERIDAFFHYHQFQHSFVCNVDSNDDEENFNIPTHTDFNNNFKNQQLCDLDYEIGKDKGEIHYSPAKKQKILKPFLEASDSPKSLKTNNSSENFLDKKTTAYSCNGDEGINGLESRLDDEDLSNLSREERRRRRRATLKYRIAHASRERVCEFYFF